MEIDEESSAASLALRRPAWSHSPPHHLAESGVYMVTAGTHRKAPLFRDGPPLRMLHDALLKLAHAHGWLLEAWAVFPNHYHFVAISPARPESLTAFLRELHSRSAVALNRYDRAPGRKIWHNYWDTRITRQTSYFARLNYVHQNALKHRRATVAADYPWCSARWFETTASAARVKTIYSFKTDTLAVRDDF